MSNSAFRENVNQEQTKSPPHWSADEYDAGNDGQFTAASAALTSANLWQPPAGGRSADIGCGSGKMAEAMALQGWQVYAQDVSESMIEATRDRCKGLTVEAHAGDAATLQLPLETFDLVTSFWMIHWLSDAAPLLTQMANAVKPGGHLVLQWSCGQPELAGFRLKDTIQEVFDRPHWSERLKSAPLAMHQHPVENVRALLENCGYEILSAQEHMMVSGGETPEKLKRALRSAAFAAQTRILGNDVDQLIDECLKLLVERDALIVGNTEIIARRK